MYLSKFLGASKLYSIGCSTVAAAYKIHMYAPPSTCCMWLEGRGKYHLPPSLNSRN